MKVEIDWDEVAEAMERSIRGQASQEDRDLFQKAWSFDREKYSNLHKKVHARVRRSINPLAHDDDV